MSKRLLFGCAIILLLNPFSGALAKKKKVEPAPLDTYVEQAQSRGPEAKPASPGSIWTPDARLAGLGLDPRASRVDDIVTIVVTESASAVASGTVVSQRNSSLGGSVAAGNSTSPTLKSATLSGGSSLNGQGSTSRATTITTTLTARVVRVLQNGNLVLEGQKLVGVNSEQQAISVRGVIRPIDLAPDNSISSDRVAQMEVSVNGKGIVGSSVRRPMFLYRLLLGLLPF